MAESFSDVENYRNNVSYTMFRFIAVFTKYSRIFISIFYK